MMKNHENDKTTKIFKCVDINLKEKDSMFQFSK